MKRPTRQRKQPSESRSGAVLYLLVGLFSLAGLADATYLTVQSLTGEAVACGGSANCSEVLGSAYAHIGGIPLAAFGALGYFGAFSFATFAGFGYRRASTFLAGTVWSMVAVSLWLLYLQAFVLHAFCRYCLFSAAITFLLAGLVVARPQSD